MNRRILIGGSTLAAVILLVGLLVRPAPVVTNSDVAELYDPTPLAKGLCGGADTRGGSLRQLVQLFATPAALAAVEATDTPPLFDNLGDFHMPVTTQRLEVQAYFDQGMRLVFGFNHAEAIRAFKAAQAIDPGCAMCYWGEALALGPNINAPMAPAANAPAFAALTEARARAPGATETEQALIEALAARYAEQAPEDRSGLDGAYADAMKAVHERFPDDHNIAVLYAESAMDTQPWDYWETDFATPKGRIGGALDAVEQVLAVNPSHPGAIHLYIHMTEASVDPWRAESYADTLRTLMPGQGHLVHMPTHTYYRIGRFKDSLAANIDAAAADEAYLQTAGDGAVYRYGYYPHNVHFLMTSAQMAGDEGHAVSAAGKLSQILNDDIVAAVPWVQPVKAAPYLTHAQFSTPETILAQEKPSDRFPFVVALWHYARGVAMARQGRGDAAAAEAAEIANIRDTADLSVLIDGGVPAKDILSIAENVVKGRIAMAAEDYEAAIASYQRAVALEDMLPYTEPPYWYYPVRQSLGSAQLLSGQHGAAIQTFREALLRVPNNGWALYGLSQAYEAAGDRFAASQTRELYKKAWAGSVAPSLAAI